MKDRGEGDEEKRCLNLYGKGGRKGGEGGVKESQNEDIEGERGRAIEEGGLLQETITSLQIPYVPLS